MTDDTREADARAAVTRYVARGGALSPEFTIEPADFEYEQLLDWRYLLHQIGASHEVVSVSSVMDRKNRILIGVIDSESTALIQDAMNEHEIPSEAVDIQVIPQLREQQDLQSQHDTLVGGLRVRLPRGLGTEDCTLTGVAIENHGADSFNLDGPRYLMTNSHCTEQFGSVTGVKMYQAAQPRQVGVEFIDPPLRSSSSLPGCPTTQNRCRFSDAALFEVDDGGETIFGIQTAFDSVAWAGWDGNISYLGRWPLEGRQASVWTGQNARKVGSETGTTSGHVVDICLTHSMYYDPQDPPTPPTPRHNVCQIAASYSVAEGDSGAPVMHISTPWTRIFGIHVGRTEYDDEEVAVFSWITHVESEMANAILAETGTLWAPVLTASPLVY